MIEKESWPQWESVLEVWNKQNVPDVDVIAFDINCHYPTLPWLNKKSGYQLTRSTNPQESTAFHLCSSIPSISPELMMPYKLLAYCRENHSHSSLPGYILSPVFKSFGSALNEWWSGNAKYVLPPLYDRADHDEYDERDIKNSWVSLVEHAAAEWTAIANNWAVIRIPSFMDPRSSEFEEYQQYSNKLYEQRERQEYERLKNKFEK